MPADWAARAVLLSMGLLRIADLKESIVAGDSGAILYRNGFGIAGVDTGTVRAVTDTLVCTRVTQTVDSAFSSPLATTFYFLDTTFAMRFVVP